MTESKHEEIVLTGEKTYYGVNCNANTKKQSIIPERLQQLYNEVAEVYNGKGMYVYPSPIDHLRHEIMKVCNEKVMAEERLTEAEQIIKILIECLYQDANDPETQYYIQEYLTKAETFIKEKDYCN